MPTLVSTTRRNPILVTGVPRSGTTWLARALACAPGTALAGREPMNPRRSQYGLGGTLEGWTRLEQPTAKQRRALRSAYRGLNPLVYGRYGHRQWAAPLPTSRIIVKDPFALLSLPAIAELTGALPVIVYRHPGAVLSSYRRMGWSPDVGEMKGLLDDQAGAAGLLREPPPVATALNADVVDMARMWTVLHAVALADLDRLPGALVVAHEDLASGGAPAMRQLFAQCGLDWSDKVAPMMGQGGGTRAATAQGSTLHDFRRAPAQVARAWRAKMTDEEIEVLEGMAGAVLRLLDERRVRF